MQSTFRLTNADDTLMTMTIVMPLRDWKALHAVVCDSEKGRGGALWALHHRIRGMVDWAHKHFEIQADAEVKDGD